VDQGDQAVTARSTARLLLSGALLLTGCSDADEPGGTPDIGAAGSSGSAAAGEPPYATSVESFTPGEGAGYNQAKLPAIVLGPPRGKGESAGSLDVVSLGAGGEIVLGFGERVIVDGPGPDLIVFENPFWPNSDATKAFVELGEVSLSDDGLDWQTFPCDSAGDGRGKFTGCAGVSPTLEYDPLELVPLDPEQTGGDAFDLYDLGLEQARFVKIRDLRTLEPAGTSGGFDLDAVGVVHAR
jgi:hypothetical protein